MKEYRRVFKFEKCMHVLVVILKFALEPPANDDDDEKGSNPIEAVKGATLKRPAGRDILKANAKKVKNMPSTRKNNFENCLSPMLNGTVPDSFSTAAKLPSIKPF